MVEVVKNAYEDSLNYIEKVIDRLSIVSPGRDNFVIRYCTTNETYFTLLVSNDEDRWVVTSEPVLSLAPKRSWQLIPNRTMPHVRQENGLEAQKYVLELANPVILEEHA